MSNLSKSIKALLVPCYFYAIFIMLALSSWIICWTIRHFRQGSICLLEGWQWTGKAFWIIEGMLLKLFVTPEGVLLVCSLKHFSCALPAWYLHNTLRCMTLDVLDLNIWKISFTLHRRKGILHNPVYFSVFLCGATNLWNSVL